MAARKYGRARGCGTRPWPEESGASAFILVILPESDRQPEFESHYPLTDPYYSCPETAICGCPLFPGNRHWKIEGATPGGAFDGRVRGEPPLLLEGWMAKEERLWEHNLVTPLAMADPMSAYAVVTPDGVWHECSEAEPQDLVLAGEEQPGRRLEDPELSRFQLNWRLEVAELLIRYQHCWLLGLDASLSCAQPRRCDHEAQPGFWSDGGSCPK